jgi:hypothetical protein
MISSLGTVEAPGDFDFRLRARLASERNGSARPFGLVNFSLGFRSAAVALVVLVIGAAFVAVSFRTRLGNPATGDGPVAAQPPRTTSGLETNRGGAGVKLSEPGVAVVATEHTPETGQDALERHDTTPKRRVVRDGLASSKGRQLAIREMAGTRAPVLKASDEALYGYPTAAFPIDASYQSLKMSVDDGRGSSRTISWPTVSFGSQRTLSQSATPLMASARGAW